MAKMKANMKQFLILTVLVLAGCGEQTAEDIMKEVNAHGTLTVRQAEIIVQNQEQSAHDQPLYLNGLTSINDAQAESLGKSPWLLLNGLTSMTDTQAKSFTKVVELHLNGLTSITNAQAKCFTKIKLLQLNGLSSISDEQADSLSKVENYLTLNGLTSITDQQAASLSKVYDLEISETLQPLIDKYKKQQQ